MADGAPVPRGYTAFTRAGSTVVCLAECEESVREAVGAGSLYAYAAAHPGRRELRGRAAAYAVPLPRGCADVVVRHSWHGGVLAPLTRDLFVAPTRAPRELATALRLAERGVRTPQLVAYAVYPAGPLLRRSDVATRLVPGGRDLAAAIADRATGTLDVGGFAVGAWVRPVGALLHALSRAGATHPDLNLKNVLLTPAGGEARFDAWLLDVDVARVPAAAPGEGAAWSAAESNWARLARSLGKWRDQRGLAVSDVEIEMLRVLARRGPDADVAVVWRPRNAALHAS